MVAVATAAHVVEHADTWKEPIKLVHYSTAKDLFLPDNERVIFIYKSRDSASILFDAKAFELPKDLLPLMDADKYLPIGQDVAWIGFPGIAAPHLCFFSGQVSAFDTENDSYLIDGVAINGVSGGPVFQRLEKDQPRLVGTVSAYVSNRVYGETLPGLLRAQDVVPIHRMIKTLHDIAQARQQRKEEEKKKLMDQQQMETSPAPAEPAVPAVPAEPPAAPHAPGSAVPAVPAEPPAAPHAPGEPG